MPSPAALPLLPTTWSALRVRAGAQQQLWLAQGKTNREIERCLVRYVAHQLYRLLEANPCFDPT